MALMLRSVSQLPCYCCTDQHAILLWYSCSKRALSATSSEFCYCCYCHSFLDGHCHIAMVSGLLLLLPFLSWTGCHIAMVSGLSLPLLLQYSLLLLLPFLSWTGCHIAVEVGCGCHCYSMQYSLLLLLLPLL